MVGDFLRWCAIPFILGMALGFAGIVRGEEKPVACQDMLGLLHEDFPVDDLLPLLPTDGFCGSHLDWTFSTRLVNLKKVLDTGKVTSWQIDFFNGPGLRNQQLGRYEPHFGYTVESFNREWENGGGKLRRHLRDRVRLYCNLFENYPSVALEMSPTLEHNLSSKAFKEQAAVIKRNCPRAVVVDNPVKGVSSTRGFKIERHGDDVRGLRAPCSVSLDGDEAFDTNIPAFLERNPDCTKYIWSYVYNGRSTKGEFVDPRKRTRWPTPEQFRTLLTYAEPLPEAPVVSGCREIQSPRLWKVSADNHQIGDVRANKPLWLTSFKSSEVEVFTAVGGRSVGTLAYYGPFDGGGFRYYSGTGSNLYGIEFSERAERLTGSPYVTLREGGQCFGPFHPAYRHGSFR